VQAHEVPAGALAIDTDASSAVHWGRGRQAEFSALIDGHELAMPFAVVGELWVGSIHAGHGGRRRGALAHAIGDLWVAACCLVYGLPLVTANLRDFTTIRLVEPRLRLVHPDL